MKLDSFLKFPLVIFLMCFVGCASMAERGLLRDVQFRQPPVVSLGPEFTLHDRVNLRYNSRFKAILTGDGHGHVFVIDEKRTVHHIEIAGNEVLLSETLGSLNKDIDSFRKIDAVEHPKGTLRVVAGNKMFTRSGHGAWT